MAGRRTDGGFLTSKKIFKNPQSANADSPLDKGAYRKGKNMRIGIDIGGSHVAVGLINKKYELGSEKTKRATISFKKNGVDYLFSAIEGYIVFTDLWRGSSSSIISGCFEFTAIDIEKGLTLKVTNGIFQDLEC